MSKEPPELLERQPAWRKIDLRVPEFSVREAEPER
jgi:hypothetical protein